MPKKDFAVIVIGAGPAGATVARIVARAGLSVIVFDKKQRMGEPLRCAEAIYIEEINKQGLSLPQEAISTSITGVRLVAPCGKSLAWELKRIGGFILERKVFDPWLVKCAVNQGAIVKTNHRVIDLIKEKDKIIGVKVKNDSAGVVSDFTANLIVSAEGMESLIARRMGFISPHKLTDLMTCYEYDMELLQQRNFIEVYFGQKVAPHGYAWIFPKNNGRANVGVGIGAHLETALKGGAVKGASPKRFLDDFVKQNDNLENPLHLREFGGVMSMGAPLKRLAVDNAIIVGTAAKQVDPLSGAGIDLAMEAGAYAGRALIEAANMGNFSGVNLRALYEKPWKKTVGKRLFRRLLLKKAVEALNDDDLNYIFSNISQNDLELMEKENKYTGALMKLIARRPNLLKIFRAIF